MIDVSFEKRKNVPFNPIDVTSCRSKNIYQNIDIHVDSLFFFQHKDLGPLARSDTFDHVNLHFYSFLVP
jgi:hypothetical protein